MAGHNRGEREGHFLPSHKAPDILNSQLLAPGWQTTNLPLVSDYGWRTCNESIELQWDTPDNIMHGLVRQDVPREVSVAAQNQLNHVDLAASVNSHVVTSVKQRARGSAELLQAILNEGVTAEEIVEIILSGIYYLYELNWIAIFKLELLHSMPEGWMTTIKKYQLHTG